MLRCMMSDFSLILDVGLRGSRDYLQSADLYCSIRSEIKHVYGLQAWVKHLSFRSFIKRKCEFRLIEKSEKVHAAGIVKVIVNDDEEVAFALVESCDMAKVEYVDIDNEIFDLCSLNKKMMKVSTQKMNEFDLIYQLVSMTKFLHFELIDNQGKWIFTQIDMLSELPMSFNNQIFEVRFRSVVAKIYTVSDVILDGKVIGTIRFMKI